MMTAKPVLVSSDGVLLSGHRRVAVATFAGLGGVR